MRLNSLRLCNFRQHLDTRIEFDTGITGIIGPNGSGKSTLLEAIAWALYGMPAARGTRESIRSYRAAPRAAVKVELDFELAGHRYFVSRGLTSAELYLDGATAPIATSITGVTDLLRRRLGMSHDEFFNTYFTGQKELSVMAAMGAAERAQFLSRVLGYERLRTAQGLVRDRRKAIVAELTGLRAGMPDSEAVTRALQAAELRLGDAEQRARVAADRRTRVRASLDELTPRWEALQEQRDALQALTAELRVAEAELAACRREAARIDAEVAGLARAREELEALAPRLVPLAALQSELQELDRACNEEARRQTLAENERLLAEELVTMRERRARIASAPALEQAIGAEVAARRAELAQADAALEVARTDWIRDRQEAETKRQALLDQLRDVTQQRDQIVELGENGICPTCARPLNDHFRTVLDLLDSQIETITVDGKYYRARIDQLAEMPPQVKELEDRRREALENVARVERRIAKVQAAIDELAKLEPDMTVKEKRYDAVRAEQATIRVSYDAGRHAEAKRELDVLAPLATRAARLAAQLEREPQLQQERARALATDVAAQARTRELATRRDALQFSDAGFAELRGSYEQAAAELRAAELAAVGADAEVGAARAALASADQARAELTRVEQQLELLTRDRRLHEELDRAYTDLRTDLNQQLRPEISELASRYLRELTDGRYAELELDEQYNVMVLEDGIPKPVISGGEEDLANLVLRLAISQMIAERAGQSFCLLILDEVFGSLDEARRHNVVELLRRLEDRFEQVILITHIESVREGVDRVVTVRYDDETGVSRVEADASAAPVVDFQGAAD